MSLEDLERRARLIRNRQVIFLDFDGVLNNSASFHKETKLNEADPERNVKVNETLCPILTKNFQTLLDTFPEAKVVISSFWRTCFTLDWLKEKLASYGIDSSRVIDKTYNSNGRRMRGGEIAIWLQDYDEYDKYLILDDNVDDLMPKSKTVETNWCDGFSEEFLAEAIQKMRAQDETDSK